jgi:hypothetical protein
MSDQSNHGRDGAPEYGTAPEGAPGAFGSEPVYPGQSAHPGQQAHPSYPPEPTQYPYPEPSQGALALVLGIIGLFVIQLVAPFAWVVSNRELRGIDAGRRDPTNRGLAVAGKVMGIIGTVLLVIGIVIFIVAIIVLVSFSRSSSS